MRIFIAVDIPEKLKEKIYKISQEIKGVNGKFVEQHNYHITLKFIGEIPPHVVKRIESCLSEIYYSKFTAETYGIGTFGNRVLWIGIRKGKEDLIKLQNIIDNRLRNLGFPIEKEYIPHITIVRIKQIFNEKLFRDFIDKYNKFSFGEFTIEKFTIKQSILTPKGPIYRDIREFQLTD